MEKTEFDPARAEGSETAQRMLAEAGFAEVERKSLPHDVINHYHVARKAG